MRGGAGSYRYRGSVAMPGRRAVDGWQSTLGSSGLSTVDMLPPRRGRRQANVCPRPDDATKIHISSGSRALGALQAGEGVAGRGGELALDAQGLGQGLLQ